MNPKFNGVLISAGKAGLFSGMAAVLVLAQSYVPGTDLKKFVTVLLIAFVTAAIKGIEKYFNWNEQQ